MDVQKQKLLIEQMDKKLSIMMPLEKNIIPQKGWVYSIRTVLKMSLRQLGKKLKISPQSVKEIEERESNGAITIKSLKEVANALEMKLIYGFIPKNGSIEKMIENRANEIARAIVLRTSNTMKLEDQENTEEQINKAIKSKAEELKSKMPKYLWD